MFYDLDKLLTEQALHSQKNASSFTFSEHTCDYDEIEVFESGHFRSASRRRNRAMVDRTDPIICCMKDGSFYNVDQGAEPDFAINKYEHLFDREWLAKYINDLA